MINQSDSFLQRHVTGPIAYLLRGEQCIKIVISDRNENDPAEILANEILFSWVT